MIVGPERDGAVRRELFPYLYFHSKSQERNTVSYKSNLCKKTKKFHADQKHTLIIPCEFLIRVVLFGRPARGIRVGLYKE